MRSVALTKLEALSEKQAGHSREKVERHQRELTQAGKNRENIESLSNEYQNSVVGQDGMPPRLLEHRRAFVAQLSLKLDALEEQQRLKALALQASLSELKHHSAQSAALGTLVEREQHNEQTDQARKECRQQDDSAAARWISIQTEGA